MEENLFLYGAAVQGIQGFIFQTDILKEIIGASEIVEEVGDIFKNEFAHNGYSIINAAGNIKYIFSKIEDCEKAVYLFPKRIMTMVPGITLSQAVVDLKDKDFSQAITQLDKLLKIQRNKPSRSLNYGMIGMERSRQTGLPVSDAKNHWDLGTCKKMKSSRKADVLLTNKGIGNLQDRSLQISSDFAELGGKKNWIAVVHADGNSLGKVVMSLGKEHDKLSDFSIKLEQATKNSCQKACNNIIDKYSESFENNVFPFRPIILGGDDLTVVCRGDMALDFTNSYLKFFEEETHEKLGVLLKNSELKIEKLTACAGISFIKSSFPFHYGCSLAEELCKLAKKISREMDYNDVNLPSSLMFHKVQDSFISNFKDIEERESIPENFGPYFLNFSDNNSYWSIDQFFKALNFLKMNPSFKSNLREWVTSLSKDTSQANQKLNRIYSINKEIWNEQAIGLTTFLKRMDEERCPVFDALSVLPIMNHTN